MIFGCLKFSVNQLPQGAGLCKWPRLWDILLHPHTLGSWVIWHNPSSQALPSHPLRFRFTLLPLRRLPPTLNESEAPYSLLVLTGHCCSFNCFSSSAVSSVRTETTFILFSSCNQCLTHWLAPSTHFNQLSFSIHPLTCRQSMVSLLQNTGWFFLFQ